MSVCAHLAKTIRSTLLSCSIEAIQSQLGCVYVAHNGAAKVECNLS